MSKSYLAWVQIDNARAKLIEFMDNHTLSSTAKYALEMIDGDLMYAQSILDTKQDFADRTVQDFEQIHGDDFEITG